MLLWSRLPTETQKFLSKRLRHAINRIMVESPPPLTADILEKDFHHPINRILVEPPDHLTAHVFL